MATRSGSTFEITADASQALATFKEVHQAAVDAQKISAAGTPGASTKFTSGQYTQARREAQGYLEDLEKIKRATQALGKGERLPEGFFPGFKGGTAAQAAQFQGVQRQQNIATNVGTKAALAGIAVPKEFLASILKGFQDNLQSQARAALHALQVLPETKVFNREAIGTTRQVQLAQGSRSALGIADTARTTVQDRQQATRDAAATESARQRAERADRDQRERDDNARAARERNDENRRLREERVQQDRAATEARRRAEFEAGRTPTGGGSGSGPGRPLKLGPGSGGDDEGLNPSRGQKLQDQSVIDSLEARKVEAERARRNVALLRDESKNLLTGIFQGANDLIVDFRHGLLNLYERTRAGERQIPRDAPEFQSALTGALQNRQQAAAYLTSKRKSDPNNVIDIDAKTTAVIEDGVTRIFKAMQNGERETIATLPEFERNFAKLSQILRDRADDAALAARKVGAASDPRAQILPVSQNRTVDFSGDTPQVFKRNLQGQREQLPTGGTAASFRESISQAYDQLSQQARKEFLNQERLVRPNDFVDLGNGFFADIGNKQRAIYKDLGAGVDAITETTRGFATQSKALNRLVERTPEGDNVLSQARRGPLTGAEASDKARQSATAEDERRSRARGVLETRAENEGGRRRRASEVQTARAEAEDARRTKKAQTNLRARGQLETRAATEDARRRRAGEVQIAKAENEDGRRTRKAESKLRARGQLETRAANEGARRRRAGEVQITQAENEGARRRRASEVQITQAENEGARRRRASEVQITQAENEGTRRRRASEVQIARAENEDTRRTRKSETNRRARGQLETRAANEDARRRRASEVQITQAENEGQRRRRASEVQIARAENEDARRARKSETKLRARGQLETRAATEDARRRRAGEVQITQAENEGARRRRAGEVQITRAENEGERRRRAGEVQIARAENEDARRTRKKETNLRARGVLETRAAAEGDRRRRAGEVQIARAESEDGRRTTKKQTEAQAAGRREVAARKEDGRLERLAIESANAHRLESLRAQGRAVEVKGGRTVDFTPRVPVVYKTTPEGGARIQTPLQAPVAVRRALDEANKRRDQIQLKADIDRVKAVRPQDFVSLGNGISAFIGNKQKLIYRDLGDAYERIEAGNRAFTGNMKKLGEQIRTLPNGDNILRQASARTTSNSTPDEREFRLREQARQEGVRRDEPAAFDAERQRNREGGRGQLPLVDAATGLTSPGVIQFGQYLADLRGPTLELYKDFIRLGHASNEYASTQGRLITNLARQSRPGIGGAIVSGLVGGFGSEGGSATGIIEGLAKSGVTTAKYAALGTVLYGLSGAAAQAFSEFEDFNDSLVELEVAFQRTDVTGQSFLNDLADSASESGANVGEAMDVAASAVRAFGNTTTSVGEQSTEQLQIMAASFAKEASRIALLTKTSLTDAAGNLKAIALGFKIPDSNFSRVTDALANAKIVGGGDEKQIGQGVANISVAAKEAGFSLEEIGNIVSDIVAKTDQGGQLVAQRLSRAFSIIGGQAGQAAIRRLNAQLAPDQRISQGRNTTPAEQIKELSSVYGNLTEAQRKLLNNQLGGTANARELIILLEDANKLTSEASLDAAGKGAEEYEKRLKNIRALITQITGNLKNLVSAVGNSGLLAPLGLVLKTTLLITTATRTLAETFDRIPSIVRNIAGLLVGILVTSRAITAIRDAGGVKKFVRQIEERYTPGRAYARGQLEAERTAQETANGIGIVGTNAQKIKAEKDALEARRQARRDLFNVAQPVKGGPLAGKLNDASLRVDKTIDRVRDFRDRAQNRYNTAQGLGASRYDSLIAAASTPYNPQQVGGSAPVPRSQRVTAAIASGRAQLNGAGVFGALGIAGAGIATIASIGEANKRIQHAVNEFGRLRDLPQSFGVDDLKDSAANLRSAAKALKESSSGILGTVVNFLQGDPTGKAAKEATERADAADTARKIIERAQKKAALSDTPDNIAGAIDYSSDDALTSSIDALGKSGRDATTQMDAFQAALQGINTEGESATRKLTEAENLTIGARAGDLSVTDFQNAVKLNPQGGFASGNGLSVTRVGRFAPNFAAAIDTVTSPYRAIRGDTKETSALKKVDTGKLQTETTGIVNRLLNTGGFDINSKAGQNLLRRQLNDSYKTFIPNDKVRKQVVQNVIGDVIAQTKDVRSVDDSTASFANLAAAIPNLAAGKAAETVVNNALATGSGRQQVSSSLLSSTTELAELQKGLATLESKTDGSEENNKQLDLLRAQVKAKKVEFAEATVANMEAAFQLYEASQPSENTTQNLQDTLKNIDERLAVPGISVDTERALTIAKNQAQQQLPAAQIADNIATQRAGVDTRDTLANDQLDIDQTNAELDDYKNRNVTGKALADKQKQLDDQKRKLANDQANYALSERIASSPIGSALQDAKNNLDTAQVNLDQQLAGSEAYNQAKRAVDASKVQVADAAIADSQAQFQLDQSTKPTENTTDNLQAQAGELEKELKTKDIGSDAARAIQTQLNALYPQIVASIIADTFAGLRASTDSRDVVGLDKISEQQIQAELNDFNARGVTGKALADKQVELADAKRKTIDDEKDLALQQKIATFDPDSAVDSAQAALLTAAENLRKSQKDTAEYAKAQAAYKKALKDDADAKLQAADQARLLTIDLSNPVQVAKDANKLAGEELKKARSDGSSPDTVNKKIYAKRQTQLAEDAAIFNAFLTAAQNADSLGDISHRAYIDLLQGRLTALQAEAVLLDPNSNGFKQNQDFQTQLRMALKAAGDELSGQFNIGDIKIPTPYQVRRAIKAGNTGSILASNSPNSTAGNVTNDTSTKSVVLNGVPIQQVIALIEDLFGVKVKTKNNGRKKP